MSSLYERLGGAAAVDAAVDLFYTKVLADDRIKHFFDGVDMKRQAGHQKAFFDLRLRGITKLFRQEHARRTQAPR
jgi:truncated hemoglobin YjbI